MSDTEKAGIEFELKFQVEPANADAVEVDVARGTSRQERSQARYYDTPTGALAEQRIVLRVRKEGAQWVQTAKAPGQGPLHRHEHNVPLPASRSWPLPVLSRHDGTPIGALIAKALQTAGTSPDAIKLVPLYTTDVRRTLREMRTGDATVELAFDRGMIRAGSKTHALCELEIELKDGDPSSLMELGERWCSRHRLWIDTVSKSMRGERLAKGVAFGPAVKAEPPSFASASTNAKNDGASIFRAMLDSCLAQMLPNASDVAAGSNDADQIHQLRVSIRRLRTGLREMAPLAAAFDPGWEPVLVNTFRALGELRDRDNLIHKVQPRVLEAGGPEAGNLKGKAAARSAADIVREPAFQQVLIQLIESALPTSAAAPADEHPAMALLGKRLAKLHRQVVRAGRRFDQLDSDSQHQVRKRLKRLRYLGEFVAPLFDRKARRYLKALEPAQDALGAHNDEVAAIAAYREAAEADGRAWFAVGWLTARQPASAQTCRLALAKVADAKPFWKAAGK